MKKFKNLFIYTIMLAGVALYSCEGPMGPAGKDGQNGQDANESCKTCHNPAKVDLISTQYELSKHSYGEAATEEQGNTGCGPCHLQEAFKDVVANNVSTVFVADPNNAGKFLNPYACSSDKAYGEIGCSTCHSSLHTTYGIADISPLTTVAAVPMTMWSGQKTIDLTQGGGKSNLCVKCHQPRPFTNSNTDKNVLDYANLVANPTAIFYSAADPGVDVLKPGYRTHTHYGTAGAIFAGKGGVEFTGALSYTSSTHTTVATCQDCHMATMNGKAGGHSFFAKGNFNGCTTCHPNVTNASQDAAYWTTPRAEIKTLIDQLAAKLFIGGVNILNINPDATANLWVSNSTNKYDGYLNIYDPINNPSGLTNNPLGSFKATSTTGFSSAQVTTNNSLPAITLTNAQMGAIINFQLCLRDYSLGIHNYKYTKALLTNSIAALP